MEPTIKVGELIIIKPSDGYYIGDIITFRSPGTTSEKYVITHRISEEIITDNSTGYKTKGDASNTADSHLVKKEDILGKYRFSIPYLGYLIGYVKTLPGLILIIVIPVTIIIYEESRKVHREAKLILKKRRAKKSESQKSELTQKDNKASSKGRSASGGNKGEGRKDDAKTKKDS